jgi:MFS family permease
MAEVSVIARAPGEALDPRRWAALAILLVGAFLAPLDFFIVNVALPAMAAGLKASAAEMQLVISGYAVVYAVLLITGGRLGRYFRAQGRVHDRPRRLRSGVDDLRTRGIAIFPHCGAIAASARRGRDGAAGARLGPRAVSCA